MVEHLHSIAFTHRQLPVEEIGRLHIAKEQQVERLSKLKKELDLQELMFLSTCNRVEFLFVTKRPVDYDFYMDFFASLYPGFSRQDIGYFAHNCEQFGQMEAISHLLRVASSIDSMIVGEREIITQVREAFEFCRANKLSGDTIRLAIRHTIETAKRVYTETQIAEKPVSVVALAYHELCRLEVPVHARVVIVGAGVTNTNMARFLKKHGYTDFVVFNRTLEKAQQLADEIEGKALPLEELKTYSRGFDILLACTGTDYHLITPELYANLLGNDTDRKVVVDIAIPQDLDPQIKSNHRVHHISVSELQQISNKNLQSRTQEVERVEQLLASAISDFEHIQRLRQVEIAMREVPQQVKTIKSTAMNEVFKNEVSNLDENSRAVLEKVIDYMEKKYMSGPMLMAKEILLKN